MITTFVNGIYHSVKDVADIENYLKNTFNTEVRSFYNPSSGSWVMDAYKAGFELVLRPSDLVLARQLAEHLRKALKDVRTDGGRVLHIAHSGGAILTYLAAKYHLTSSETSRIDVITLGGGRSITHKYFKGRVYNYYARNDPVLMVDSRAARLMKKAKNTTYAVVQDAKHNTTFIFLEAIAKDPVFDHAMEGPTYRKALLWEALQYQERLQRLRNHEAREKDVVRQLRKKAANYTGLHHFWDIYTPDALWDSGRVLRKYASNYTNIHGLFSGKYRALTHTDRVVTERGLAGMPDAPSIAQLLQEANNTVPSASSVQTGHQLPPAPESNTTVPTTTAASNEVKPQNLTTSSHNTATGNAAISPVAANSTAVVAAMGDVHRSVFVPNSVNATQREPEHQMQEEECTESANTPNATNSTNSVMLPVDSVSEVVVADQ
jgi:hypothetical protein